MDADTPQIRQGRRQANSNLPPLPILGRYLVACPQGATRARPEDVSWCCRRTPMRGFARAAAIVASGLALPKLTGRQRQEALARPRTFNRERRELRKSGQHDQEFRLQVSVLKCCPVPNRPLQVELLREGIFKLTLRVTPKVKISCNASLARRSVSHVSCCGFDVSHPRNLLHRSRRPRCSTGRQIPPRSTFALNPPNLPSAKA
jgi:hypothetical protein